LSKTRIAVAAGPIRLNMIHEVHNLRMLRGSIVAVQALASNAVRGFPVAAWARSWEIP
jgi:hypothetical protein